jgi:CTP:molybdopterin cytidylyltransferase MocA
MNDQPALDVVLPAGGMLAGELADATGVRVKALLPLGPDTLLGRTLALLRQVPGLGRLVVVGPPELLAHSSAAAADALVPAGESGPENIQRGLAFLREGLSWQPGERALVVATDLPFLQPGDIAELLARCPAGAALAAPVHTRPQFEAAFPGSPIEYVRLRDAEWTMGCGFVVAPAALAVAQPHLDRIFAARKNQLHMARLLGPVFVARFLLHALALADIERRCTSLLQVPVAAVQGCSPRLAYDIDDLGDWNYATSHYADGR